MSIKEDIFDDLNDLMSNGLDAPIESGLSKLLGSLLPHAQLVYGDVRCAGPERLNFSFSNVGVPCHGTIEQRYPLISLALTNLLRPVTNDVSSKTAREVSCDGAGEQESIHLNLICDTDGLGGVFACLVGRHQDARLALPLLRLLLPILCVFKGHTTARAVASMLTPIERDLLSALNEGMTDSEIAVQRRRSIHTVKNQIRGLLKKFGMTRRSELACLCQRHGQPLSDFHRRYFSGAVQIGQAVRQ